MDSKKLQRRVRRLTRHVEFRVVVPIGLAATAASLVYGSISDICLLVGWGELGTGSVRHLFYMRILPGLGAMFCFYLVFRARLFAIRILALVTAIALSSRVVMNVDPSSQIVHTLAIARVLLTVIWAFVVWSYGHPIQAEPGGLTGSNDTSETGQA